MNIEYRFDILVVFCIDTAKSLMQNHICGSRAVVPVRTETTRSNDSSNLSCGNMVDDYQNNVGDFT